MKFSIIDGGSIDSKLRCDLSLYIHWRVKRILLQNE
jgi:hypothetical protein